MSSPELRHNTLVRKETMMTTRRRSVRHALVAALASACLVISSCRGGGDSEAVGSDDEAEFRDAPPPAQIAAEVDTLRGQALVLAPSTLVGTLPGFAGVDASGQANYTIPLQLAPGVSRLSPELAISYDSGRGNGIIGVGFGLSGQSSIQRCTATILDDGAWAPVEWTTLDPLCLDGDRLVLESGTYGLDGSKYRLRHDPSRRAVLHGDISIHTSWFEVFHGDGEIDTYGGGTAALWRGPNASYAPYVWGLAQKRDRYDNAIDYVYSHPALLDTGPSQLRLEEIRYAGTGALATQRRVIFDYEGRDDVLDTWFYGARQRIDTRLSTISVIAQNVLQHTYELEYDDGLGGRSQLQSMQLCDRVHDCLPPTTFSWAEEPEMNWTRDNILQGSSDYFLNDLGAEEVQQVLLEARHMLMLDLDGDLDQELMFGRDSTNIEPWRVWNEDDWNADEGDDVIHEIAAPMPPRTDASLDEAIADVLLSFPPPDPDDVLTYYLPRFQPAISAAVINFTGHRMDDVLLPQRPAPWSEVVVDEWGHPYAAGILVGIGHGLDDIEVVDMTAGSTDPIYVTVPVDHDGDQASDIWMCRGPGYKSGHWILAHNTGASPYGYTFYDTDIGCSVHDELEVVPSRGGGQRLLVNPAYETDVSLMPVPDDFDDADEYLLDYPPIPDDERGNYLELRYDLATETGFWQPTNLPRDRFQRWHDAKCRNGMADAAVGSPILGAGLGQDKLVDLNDDGFVDVLRFELAAGDTLAQQAEIAAGLPTELSGELPHETWLAPHQCDESIADHQDAGIRVYWNTGESFVQGDLVHEFEGIAHANYWVNFVGAQALDADDDGRTDLMLPSRGEGGEGWTLLRALGGGTFDPDGAGNTSGWPAYNDDAAWEDALERSQKSRLFALQVEPGQRPLLVFIGLVPEELDPEHNWIGAINAWDPGFSKDEIGRVLEIHDGLGKVSTFDYGLALAEDNLEDPGGHRVPLPVAPLVVGKWCEQTNSDPNLDLARLCTTYTYSDPLVDRWGRGLLGFRTIETTTGGEHRRTHYAVDYNAVVGDYVGAGRPIEDISWHVVEDTANPSQMLVHVERMNTTWTTLSTPLLGGETLASWAATVRSRSYGTTTSTCDGDALGEVPSCADVIGSLTAYRDGTITEVRDAFGTVTSLVTDTWLGEDRTWTALNIANDTASWLLGRIGKTTDRSCSYGGNCKTRTTTFEYSPSAADLEQTTQEPDDPALELVTDFTRDPYGNVETMTLTPAVGAPRWATTEWDAAGVHPLSHTNSLGQIGYVIHDPPSGALLAAVDVAGTTIRYGYDTFLREVSRARHATPIGAGDGAVATTEYMTPDPAETASSMRVRTQVTSGQQVTAHLDATARPLKRVWWGMLPVGDLPPQTIGHGADVYQEYTYDVRGRQNGASVPQWVGQPTPGWTTTELDSLGRHVRTTAPDPDGTVVATTRIHNGAGAVGSTIETVTDADGHSTRKSYDAQGVLVESVDAANTATCYTPGAFGQILQVRRNCSAQPGPQPITTMTYDVLGHLATELESSFAIRRLYWNAFGELDHTINGNTQTTTWFRDPLGRVTNVVHPGGMATFTWDTERPGLLTSSQAPSGAVDAYEYDSFGRTERAHKTVQSTSGSDDYVLEYAWGIGDRLDQIQYPAVDGEPGLSVAFRYDDAGHLRAAQDPGSGMVHWLAQEANARTQIELEKYPNGVTTTREWDEWRGWLELISTMGPGGKLQDLTYAWKPSGDLEKRTAGPMAGNQEESFGYDQLHRLTSATVRKGGGTPVAKLTGYDRVGNITSKADVGAYGYNAVGRLQTINGGVVGHDNDGNVISQGGRSFGYTPFSKISSATQAGVTTTFAYDADQQRVRRSHPVEGDTISIGELYERELSLGGATQRITYRIVANGRVVTEVVRTPGAPWTTTRYRVHDDHLGSTNSVSNAAGVEAWGVGYDVWGRARQGGNWLIPDDGPLASIGVGFTGHRAKLDLGMIDMRGRTYDPKLGRFLQADPIVGDPTDGQSWNRYSYVGNRPLVFTDPTGWRPYAHNDGGAFDHDFHDGGGGLGRWIRVGSSSTSDPNSLFMGGYGGDFDAVPYREPGFETPGLGPGSDVGGTLSNTRISPAFYRDNAWSLNYLWRSHAEARDAAAAAAMRVRNDRPNPFAGLLTLSRGLDVATEFTLEYGSWVNPAIAAIDLGVRAGDAAAAGDNEALMEIATNAALGRIPLARGVVQKTASGKRAGDFTRGEKATAKAENAAQNGGQMGCTDCSRPLESVRSQKGVSTPPNQAQVHHDPPIVQGGGRHSEAVVLCPDCHIRRHRK